MTTGVVVGQGFCQDLLRVPETYDRLVFAQDLVVGLVSEGSGVDVSVSCTGRRNQNLSNTYQEATSQSNDLQVVKVITVQVYVPRTIPVQEHTANQTVRVSQ
jgi:uncharacterized protein (DUF2344 family)